MKTQAKVELTQAEARVYAKALASVMEDARETTHGESVEYLTCQQLLEKLENA